MNVAAIGPVRTSDLAPVPRAPRGASRTPFRETLSEALSVARRPDAVREVRRGDTLSHLVQRQLRAAGERPTRAAIYEGVAAVAKANGLRNPDLILPGQRIDFSVLGAASRDAVATAAPVHRPPAAAPVFQATEELLAVLIQPSESPKPELALLEPGDASSSPWQSVLDAPARLTSEFGPRSDPFSGRWRQHNGIDLASEQGTQVRPLLPGKVVFSGWRNGYGNTVVVRHADGLETLYGHHAENLVGKGDEVSQKTALGLVGSTGRATGPHLHFEVRRNGEAVNPLPFMTGRFTRVARG